MAELTQEERLQPSLLDRLTDLDPGSSVEPREDRFLSTRQLREAVIRDLQWLLNTGNLASTQQLDDCPEIEKSVLNYGIPDISGSMVSGLELSRLEKNVRQAILTFEPRISRHSLQVRGVINNDEMNRNAVTFEIVGEVWGDPAPFHLMLKTEMDLESGAVTVTDFG